MIRVLLLSAAAATLVSCGRASTYPPEYRAAFMSSCQVQGESQTHCACVLERLEQEIPAEEFAAADQVVQSGLSHPVAERIVALSAECRAS
ncbi:MAG: hypothetical protein AB7G05_13435 [Hyphomonadaceae bacterium]